MTFNRHNDYEKVNYQWIKEMPSHWTNKKLKHLLSSNETGIKIGPFGSALKSELLSEEGHYKVYGQENVISKDFQAGERRIDENMYKSLADYAIKSGDILITLMGSSGQCCLVPEGIEEGIIDSHLLRIRLANKRQNNLIEKIIDQAPYVRMQIDLMGKGAIMHGINSQIVKNLVIHLPPEKEQLDITAFLVRETTKIDDLIAEQERLIDLLQEKRQAVISHAVTKGLNPNALMKDSGVEWLGEVPEHWHVSEARRDIEFLTSGSRGWADFYSDKGPIFLRIANLTRDKIELKLSNIQRVTPPEGTEGARTEVKGGDVLFSITAYLGSVAVVPTNFEKAYVSQHVCLARLNKLNLSPKWLAYSVLSSSGKAYLEANSYGGTKVQLALDDIKSFPLTAPSLQEQEEIIEKLEVSLGSLDELRSKANENIALLQERRSALISAAVTGQIDVRGLVAEEEVA